MSDVSVNAQMKCSQTQGYNGIKEMPKVPVVNRNNRMTKRVRTSQTIMNSCFERQMHPCQVLNMQEESNEQMQNMFLSTWHSLNSERDALFKWIGSHKNTLGHSTFVFSL